MYLRHIFSKLQDSVFQIYFSLVQSLSPKLSCSMLSKDFEHGKRTFEPAEDLFGNVGSTVALVDKLL